jgi:hypothetical protein
MRKNPVLADLPAPRPRRGGGALSGEIRVLRALMRRVGSLADEGRSLDEMLSILETLARASAHLATLLKAEQQLESGQSVGALLNQALDEIIAEMRRNNNGVEEAGSTPAVAQQAPASSGEPCNDDAS